jgi:hypothetical protein
MLAPSGAGLWQLCDTVVGHDAGRGFRVRHRHLTTQRVPWQNYPSLSMPVEDPRRPRALVIDDNESVCEALCELLWMIGFEAEGTMSGTQGLALFNRRAFDLVTTDLMMPGMTGWEVVEPCGYVPRPRRSS